MPKKLLLFLIFILAVFGILGLYRAYQARQSAQLAQQAPPPAAPQTKITIIEGWTLQQIAADLDSNAKRGAALKHLIGADDFLAAAANFDTSGYQLLDSRPKGASLEGFIFPDTYFIPADSPSATALSDLIISKALDNFTAKFTPAMQQEAAARNMNVYQIVTLASIIEKETGRQTDSQAEKDALQEERKNIASIFYNRLEAGMPLESDATVNYATGKNLAAPSIADTKTNSPYNTYLHAGLPPGPICNPSLSSLLAALEPSQTDYLYFLHDQKTGQVYYARTYEEHLANKQKYLSAN
ncbi:MAG TPA: endolytic transglycosylase MltG [Patescibacteria group bacterium]|nr:endolytic transglycosylase MltG [Patescibacteria group bacterium]